MGLAGGLVKKVFSNKSQRRDGNAHSFVERSILLDKGKWGLCKIKLCGDDFESVLADEGDLVYKLSSGETIVQPVARVPEATDSLSVNETSGIEEILLDNSAEETEITEQEIPNEEVNSNTKILQDEDAAIIIQSAFRGFLARHRCKLMGKNQGTENPSRDSMGASAEVRAGDFKKNLKIQGENIFIQHKVQNKARPQVSYLKEEWDDSTVSSNILKLRIQNRMEAMNRRERALAYAFSQQLRSCSTKKRPGQCESREPNLGWSWLERWMATRLPENSAIEGCPGKKVELFSGDQRSILFKKKNDLAFEEKGSCGSNDIPVSFHRFVVPSPTVRDGRIPTTNWSKAPRTAPRRNNSPNNQIRNTDKQGGQERLSGGS